MLLLRRGLRSPTPRQYVRPFINMNIRKTYACSSIYHEGVPLENINTVNLTHHPKRDNWTIEVSSANGDIICFDKQDKDLVFETELDMTFSGSITLPRAKVRLNYIEVYPYDT